MMKIKKVRSSRIPTEVFREGKEFVSLETLIGKYGVTEPEHISSITSKIKISCHIRNEPVMVEKWRNNYEVKILERLHSSNKQTPLVTCDGWVYWSFGGHDMLQSTLACLYTGGKLDPDNESNSFFMIENGLAWMISGARTNRIICLPSYVPRDRGEKYLFGIFRKPSYDIDL
jgi:hypothetical protein